MQAGRADERPVETGQVDALAGLYIGLVGPVPPPSGGMAHQTEQLYRLLSGEGARVEWVPTNASYRPAWAARVRGLRAVFRLLPYVRDLAKAARGADLFHVMANSGWSWFLFAVPAILAGRLRGIPVVVNYRGGYAALFMRRFGWAARPFMRLATVMVVPSEFLQRVFAEHDVPVRIVPNVVDVERFPFRQPPDEVPAAPHLVSTRNLESIYGNDVVLRAFARLRERMPAARLTIAGVGPERERLLALMHELGVVDTVEFCGRLDRAQMARLLGSADLLLNASRVDNMPNSLLEALAAGVPVVTTDAGGIPSMVEHERTALIAPVDDAETLAEYAWRLLADRTLAANCAVAGHNEAKRHSWQQLRGQWVDIYGSVLRGHGKATESARD